jgi:hypothetical protein
VEILQGFIIFIAMTLLICAVAICLGVYISCDDYRRGKR